MHGPADPALSKPLGHATGPGQGGFTLLELLVVITIIGILAGVGLPRLRRDTPQVRDAARVITADLNRARSEAIRLNTTVGITFSPSSGSYQAYLDANRDGTADDGSVIFQRSLAAEFPFATLASTTLTNHRLWFDVRGLPRNSGGGFGAGKVSLNSKQAASYLLEVRVASQGRIEWGSPTQTP